MTIAQDVLVQFSPPDAMLGIAGYFVAPEGTQHVIVMFSDGTLTEVYWKSGQGVNQNVLTTLPAGYGGVGAYYNSKEGSQHAIIGGRGRQLFEVYWKSGQGVQQDVLTTLTS